VTKSERSDSTGAPLLLAPRWSWWCARRTHNHFDTTIAPDPEFSLSPESRARLDAGSTHRAIMREAFAAALVPTGQLFLDLNDVGLPREDLIQTTVEAMSHGISVIAGGRLPDDDDGGRQGLPGLLICQGPVAATGTFGYWPGVIKAHKTMWQTSGDRPLVYSTLQQPSQDHARSNDHRQLRIRENDSIELAHYWRMLQAAGFAATGSPAGAIIGSDRIDGSPVLAWFPMDDMVFRTFSRSAPEGYAIRTALDRHDYEHARRVEIAYVAHERLGIATDPEPLVAPIMIRECAQCPWQSVCAATLGSADPSVAVGGLDGREWRALRSLGVTTIEHLAELDTAGDMLELYLPEVGHQDRAEARLQTAIARAQMVSSGEYLRRITTGPIAMPRADVEIDLDIESDRDGRVYLWGLLITEDGRPTPQFVPIATWEPLDDTREAQLGARFWTYLNSLVEDHERSGRSVLVYHYSSPEPMHLLKLARGALARELPDEARARSFIDNHFVDLLPIMRHNFIGLRGLGLKMAATHGPEFRWRDSDPGGAQSQTWLDGVYDGLSPANREGAEVRILEYNEDDVRATRALRNWIAERR